MKKALKIHSLTQWFTVNRYKKTMNPTACIKDLAEELVNTFGDLGERKNIYETHNYLLFPSLYTKKNTSFL